MTDVNGFDTRKIKENVRFVYDRIIEGSSDDFMKNPVFKFFELVSKVVQEMVFDGEIERGMDCAVIATMWMEIVMLLNEKGEK